ARWQNENYVIRLYGILDEAKVLKAGKQQKSPITKIVADLRSKVGAHSRGGRYRNKADYRRIAALITEHLDERFTPDQLQSFNLSIDTVLARLKDRCIAFVQSLEGTDVPSLPSRRESVLLCLRKALMRR
ncbi:MAG: hypothetical protein ACC655_11510, partial [Rhodothermia bacterium]